MSATWRIIEGDCRDVLRSLPAQSVHTCVTSPPYFGLRDYGTEGQIGLEPTPDEFVAALVAVFREVRRVLRDDGTVWLSLGDSYRNGQLLGVPWRVAFAMQSDGWVLRSEIIWAKRNGLPDGRATDRPDRFHEQIFLFAKDTAHYFYDADAIREESDPAQEAHNRRYAREYEATTTKASNRQPGNSNHVGIHSRPGKGGRNKRSVWSVSVQPFPGVHSATFPPKLIEPCILAGAPEEGTVLDPFAGAGTTGMVALRHNRSFIGIELNPEYAAMARRRIVDDAPLMNQVSEVAA